MAISSVLGYFQSFVPGFRLIDGGDLLNLAKFEFSSTTGLTATAGGGSNGLALSSTINEISTVATTNDSVVLPMALPGMQVIVVNDGANTMQIFGFQNNPNTGVGDTIAGNATTTQANTTTGVTLATAKAAIFVCFSAGKWKEILTA